MTGNAQSPLGQSSDVHLDTGVETEACPLDLAPTSSTTTALVMGDALAIALLEARGFTADDFAFSHPGGTLGRQLLLKVQDVMKAGEDIPIVAQSTRLSEALLEISNKGMGMTTVIDDAGKLVGIFTDGDLRRALGARIDINATTIGELIHPGVKTIEGDMLAAAAMRIMEENRISALVVLDDADALCGVLHLKDLLHAGIA
jgi:arabinose-5-phosphate isomerase